MGRNFSIGEIECDDKQTSFCMYLPLYKLGIMRHTDFPCAVKTRSIAKAIKALDYIIKDGSSSLLISFKCYASSSDEEILSSIKKARELFTQVLVDAVLSKKKKLVAVYR